MMMPVLWIALAYGIVSMVLLVYTARLRRRVRELETAVGPQPRPLVQPAHPR